MTSDYPMGQETGPMTPEQVKEWFENQARTQIAVLHKMNTAAADEVTKAFEQLNSRLVSIVEQQVVELTLFRELENHAINGTLTDDITSRIFADLKQLRIELAEAAQKDLDTIDPTLRDMLLAGGKPN